MKSKTRLMRAMCALLFGAAACGVEEGGDDGRGVTGTAPIIQEGQQQDESSVQVNPNRRAVTPTVEGGQLPTGTFTDSSGQVQMQIWECVSGVNAWNIVTCAVGDPSYVVVGGGAFADAIGHGALLTASYPGDDNLTFWKGLSKDHLVSVPHNLRVYVIGMKLAGVSRSTLLSQMERRQFTSSLAPWPQAEVSVSPGKWLIGGGARVGGENVAGVNNLLFKSRPGQCNPTRVFNPDGTQVVVTKCFSWAAQSKDHGVSSHQSITTYAIGINPDIPGFGRLDLKHWAFTGNAVGTNSTAITGFNLFGDVVTSIGAESIWTSGHGRLLTKMSPATPTTNTGWEVRSKDHGFASAGRVDLHLISARKWQ